MSETLFLRLMILACIAFTIWAGVLGKRFRSVSVFVTLQLIVFWSIFGSISLIQSKLSDSEKLTIFETEAFEMFIDKDYIKTVAAYVLFLALLFSVLHISSRFKVFKPDNDLRFQAISIENKFNHYFLLILSGFASLFLASRLHQIEAVAGQLSLYRTQWRTPDRLFNYIAIGNISSLSIGAFLLTFTSLKIINKKRRYLLMVYPIFFAASCYPFWVTGNRTPIFISVLSLTCVILQNIFFETKNPIKSTWNLKLLVFLCLIGFLFITVTGSTRGVSLSAENRPNSNQTASPESVNETASPESVNESVPIPSNSSILNSLQIKSTAFASSLLQPSSYLAWTGRGEVMYSHSSLYGVVHYGKDLPQLSFEMPYSRYTKIINNNSTQGFTIHPLTAFWMNFGWYSIFICCIYFSVVILLCLYLSFKAFKGWKEVVRLPFMILSGATLPVLMARSGPEALWGVFLHLFLLPNLFLLPASLKKTPK